MKSSICRSARRAMAGLVLGASLVLGSALPAYAGPPDHAGPWAHNSCLAKRTLADRLEFASADRAGKLLRRPDHWARQLSDFERSARMRTVEPRATLDFLRFAGNQGLDWEAGEEAYWGALADTLSEAARGLNFLLPRLYIVKTTGLEEFNAAYHRNGGIVLPQERVSIAGDMRRDYFLLAHELFHAISNRNPDLRDELYGLLGFERFVGFEYPFELEGRRLSNPDGHRYDHALTAQTPDGTADVVPVIQSAVPLVEVINLPTMGPPAIFTVLDIVLLPVDTASGEVIRDDGDNLIRYGFGNTDWPAQMLRNSSFIIHPEELMADNFALLMEWRSTGVLPTETPGGFPVNDPELLSDIEDVLTAGCRP